MWQLCVSLEEWGLAEAALLQVSLFHPGLVGQLGHVLLMAAAEMQEKMPNHKSTFPVLAFGSLLTYH